MTQLDAEIGTTNVYSDLGYDDADGMLVKAQLATRIRAIIKERGLTQQTAADIVGMPQPKLSSLLRGQFRGISETKLIQCLTRLGSDVRIVVGPAHADYAGHVEVEFA